jgi:SpoVK/Ycf46/Vps4 family AAA+-type ATPase
MATPFSLTYQERDFETLINGLRRPASPGQLTLLVFVAAADAAQLAAEQVARDLGRQLLRFEPPAEAQTHMGETEKNLAALFDRAQSAKAILFFDEADALFGERTDAKDASDRYINIATDKLLQRIERYHGIVIVATNSGAPPVPDRLNARTVIVHIPDGAERSRGKHGD